MVDITHKSSTLRIAIAQAEVHMSAGSIDAIRNQAVPKGNVLEAARIAGLFAAKRTSDIIPDCHPLPIEYTDVRYDLHADKVVIEVEIRTIYKTGVEVEAMHAASVVALTMYDMLKPIDDDLVISSIKLLQKTGGKSSYKDNFTEKLSGAVLVCSDNISAGEKTDKSGKVILQKLENLPVENVYYDIIPDELVEIQIRVQQYVDEGIDLILLTGGTGLTPRDTTYEAIKPLLQKEIPGIGEHLRQYGQQRMPWAILSRSLGGIIGKSMIITLPGSSRGAAESMDALFPHVLHVFKMLHSGQH
ncbi:MAG: bifunctional molybdenum cofactor biosynthesis protein MoaC/MoaB [Weeksellaceae bacterium]|nr:bifunctional molybdenum cofactor biosynthesis protein MoaC/MoaB [Weeksellaceae bacterium]